MKKIISTLCTIFLFCGTPCFAASISASASETFVIAGKQTVRFICQVALSESEHPETLTFEIDYQDDDAVDDTKILHPPDDNPEWTFSHCFTEAGIFDSMVTIWVDDQEFTFNPITITVARWRFPDPDSAEKIGGISSTPAVGADGTIYVGSDDGYLYAVNPDGTRKWSFQTGGPVVSSPAIDSDGNIYFGSEDGHLYCLTPENPGTRWTDFATGGPILSSPALSRDEKTVYIASTDAGLYAVDVQTGKSKWPRAFMTGGNIVSSPVVGFDGTIYVGSLDNHLYAVNTDGGIQWEKDLKGGIYGGIALDGDGTIYVGTAQPFGAKDAANKFYAISATGNEKWHANVSSGFASTPVLQASGTICAGSYDNLVYGFDRNGGISWQFKAFSDDILGSAAVGSNGLIYTASKDGMIYALIDQYDYFKGRKMSWRYDMKMPVTASSPVVANGSVYIGTCDREEGALWAFVSESAKTAQSLSATTEADPDSPWPMMRNDAKNSGGTKFTSETIAPAVVQTDPANGAVDLDLSRNSIFATFSRPIDPSLLYIAPTGDSNGYYGFTVSPFDNDPSEFEIRWVSDVTVELVLPPGVAFEKDTTYTATLQTNTGTGSTDAKGLLYPHTWRFSSTTSEEVHYDNGRGCFISCLRD